MIRARLECRRGSFDLQAELEIPAGITALFGPSGSGKTTLMHLLLGLGRAARAEIWCNDELVERTPGGPRQRPEQRRFGAVFQEGLLFPHLTVLGNIRFGIKGKNDSGREARLAQWIELLRLGPLLQRRPHTLSGGERQRAALARALATEPRALLLDEPLSGLDETLRRGTLLALRRMRRQFRIPVLYITHSVAEVLAVADRVVGLEGGRVAWSGEPPAVLERGLGLGAEEPINFLETTVHSVDGEGLARLVWGDHELKVSLEPGSTSAGERRTLAVRPGDLILGVGELGRMSARNRLHLEVAAIHTVGHRVWVRLQAPEPFYAVVTAAARDELQLEAGRQVTVVFKAMAVDESR